MKLSDFNTLTLCRTKQSSSCSTRALLNACVRRWLMRLLVVSLMGIVFTQMLIAAVYAPASDDVQHHFGRGDRKSAADAKLPSTLRSAIVSRRPSRKKQLDEKFDFFKLWRRFGLLSMCDGRLRFHSAWALLTEAVINRDRCRGAEAAGGESIESVLMQKELDEYYYDFEGCFELPCKGANLSNIRFTGSRNPLNMWLNGMHTNGRVSTDVDHVENHFTVAITRFDYANMYFVINDWYHVYLMARFFEQPPEKTRVLLIDAHPRSVFDDAWSVLYGGSEAPVLRLSQLPPGRTLFAGGLAWSLMGAGPISKPMSYKFDPPLIDDFHRFVVARHGLPEPDDRSLDCSNISVLFLWRHDYLAHPRNPKGIVKVSNTITRIPVDVVDSLISLVVADMCATNSTARRVNASAYHEMLGQERHLHFKAQLDRSRLRGKVLRAALRHDARGGPVRRESQVVNAVQGRYGKDDERRREPFRVITRGNLRAPAKKENSNVKL